MRLVALACLLVPLATPALLKANVVIDFENLPSAYMYLGGGQNIGSFYSGVNFGSNVTGLDLTGSTAFPAHSGSIAVWDAVDLSVNISFTDPLAFVGLWYTSLDPLTVQAFDSMGRSLGPTVLGAANTDGTTGASTFLSFSGTDIESITLTGIPGDFVFDDLTYAPAAPMSEPSSSVTLALMLLLLGYCLRFRRRFALR